MKKKGWDTNPILPQFIHELMFIHTIHTPSFKEKSYSLDYKKIQL